MCLSRQNRYGRLLELGCGPGKFLGLAKKRGFKVSGIEATEELAQIARTETGSDVIVGDILKADLKEEKYDVIILLDLIDHLQDPVAVLKKYIGALKSDGLLLAFTPNHSSLIVKIARLLYAVSFGIIKKPCDEIFDCLHVIFFNRKNLMRVLEVAGYEVTGHKMIPYRPERRNIATGIMAWGLRLIERISVVVPDGPFRIVMVAHPKQ